MDFDISPNAATPIYRQIVDQVRRMVASGQLKPGDSLPSVRAVAQQHAINPMTVSKAYSLLETEELVVRLRGVGMAIAGARAASPHAAKLDMLRPALDAAALTTRQLGLSDADAVALFNACLQQFNHQDPHE